MYDENVMIHHGDELALIFKRYGEFAYSEDPMFQIGRLNEGGDGQINFRVLFSDSIISERTVFEFDATGIVASVRQGVGSHFEGAISGEAHPRFRLNSYPKMRLELGAGDDKNTDIAFYRQDDRIAGIDADGLFIPTSQDAPSVQTGGCVLFFDEGDLKVKLPSSTVVNLTNI